VPLACPRPSILGRYQRGLSGIAQRQTTPTVSLRRPPDSLVMRRSGVRFPKPVSKLMMLDKVSLTPQPARARRA
jgi:hypothetical protein